MEKKILIELFIDEADKENGLDIISFVSAPAIEKDFMHFNSEVDNFKFKSTDEEKRIVTGPAMIPNQEIVRMDAEGKPYFVFFTSETIEKAQEVFAKYGKTKATNFEHEESNLDGATVVESWIVKDPKNDKSNALGFDVPANTWMVSYKVDNDELWAKVKNGEVSGFSIEGVFSKNIVKMSEDEIDLDIIEKIVTNEDLTEEQKYNEISVIISKLV
tara:strand:+ start:492 stop:1139 length:648 start_codon:yes stop_codon:yes gene_type:complete